MARAFSSGNFLTAAAAIPISSAGTIFYRLKPSWNTLDGLSHRAAIYSGTTSGYLDFSKYLDGYVYIGALGGGDYRIVALDSTFFQAGVWANWVYIWDSSVAQWLYKNGANVASRAGGFPITTDGVFNVGGDSEGFWDGEMADLAMWNRTLTVDEMAILQATGCPLHIPRGLVSYYPLIGRNSPEPDIVSGNRLVVTGTPPATDHPRIFLPAGVGEIEVPAATAPSSGGAGVSRVVRAVNHTPRYPFAVNQASAQASGLVIWYHGLSDAHRSDALVKQQQFVGTGLDRTQPVLGPPPNYAMYVERSSTSYFRLVGVDAMPSNVVTTISFWFYNAHDSYSDQILMRLGKTGIGDNHWGDSTYLSQTASGLLNGILEYAHFSTSFGVVTPNPIPLKEWHLITMVADNGLILSIYVDGILAASASGACPGSAASSLVVGGITDISGTNTLVPVSAYMADIRVYSYPLSARTIWALYDPATRYELYQELGRQRYFIGGAGSVTPVTGRPSDHHHVLGMH